MPNANELLASIQARMDEIRPLVAEVPRLERALEVLEAAQAGTTPPRRRDPKRSARKSRNAARSPVAAPYGFKADGTPRKRPALSPDAQARAAAGRQRRKAERAAPTNGTPAPVQAAMALHVQTMTMPARELEGREVAYVTQAPASKGDAVCH